MFYDFIFWGFVFIVICVLFGFFFLAYAWNSEYIQEINKSFYEKYSRLPNKYEFEGEEKIYNERKKYNETVF